MDYITDYVQSARRHWQDAELLYGNARMDAAGYHYGFAAECGLKHALGKQASSGIVLRHFGCSPVDNLRTRALRLLGGRRASALVPLLKSATLLDGWCVAMRYAPTGIVTGERCAAWRKDASRLLGAAGIRR
jgi:hypothetical protein